MNILSCSFPVATSLDLFPLLVFLFCFLFLIMHFASFHLFSASSCVRNTSFL